MYTAEIITIGDEILIGQIVDTNSAFIADRLNRIGVSVNRLTSVSDNADAIRTALEEAEQRANLIVLTGGLGPTNDDRTKYVLADYFGSTHMVIHGPTLKFIETMMARRGLKMNELNRQQAEIPECCTVIPNRFGTAPGMWFERGNNVLIAIPGVPSEVENMLPDIVERLKQKIRLPNIAHKTMMTFGISESELAIRLQDWEKALPAGLALAYLPSIEAGVKLRLSAEAEDAMTIIDDQFGQLTNILGNHIYGYEPDTLESIIGKYLTAKGETLAIAESCTGGRIAHRITSIAGCSAYFKGGIVAYNNEIKERILGVNSASIESFGVVSSEIAKQMAEGVRKLFDVDYAIATTGIAGPSTETDTPVGLCCFGIATSDGTTTFSRYFSNDRMGNIAAATAVSLNALRLCICLN
jgi:nicotinamide-nucleotide amidase